MIRWSCHLNFSDLWCCRVYCIVNLICENLWLPISSKSESNNKEHRRFEDASGIGSWCNKTLKGKSKPILFMHWKSHRWDTIKYRRISGDFATMRYAWKWHNVRFRKRQVSPERKYVVIALDALLHSSFNTNCQTRTRDLVHSWQMTCLLRHYEKGSCVNEYPVLKQQLSHWLTTTSLTLVTDLP